MQYQLAPLPFAYDALEPWIDKQTMEVHYNGHHKSYVKKLNETLKDHPEHARKVEELLVSLDKLPESLRAPVRNNAGGHANHTLFWTLLNRPQTPKQDREIGEVIRSSFGSMETFKERFSDVAAKHFSNGWAWLCVDGGGKLRLLSTKDHESPLTLGMTPLLVLDLWEHAYYLKYQNRRPEFIGAFWNIVNWTEVNNRWLEFQSKGSTDREWRIAS